MLPETIQAHANSGLRAQEQVRKTIFPLHQLKNPNQNMYVAQQNIQEINNDTNAKPKNELISETIHAALDSRRKEETITIDSRVKAMAELYRPKSKRKASSRMNVMKLGIFTAELQVARRTSAECEASKRKILRTS